MLRGVLRRDVSRRLARILFALILIGSAVFSAGVASAAQLTLSWVDNSGGTATFGVERKTGTTGTYARIGTTPASVATYADSTAVAGTMYCYRVMASNASGDSGYSNEACGSLAAGFVVTVATTGSGSVVSAPAGITCPGTCVQSYASGMVLTLTATPASGSSFSGWSGGGCGGTAPCVLTGNTSVTVIAPFALNSTAPTPSIASLSPPSVVAGSAAFSLAVAGSGFTSGATAIVGGQVRSVTFSSATQLTIAVQAGDVASQGNVAVQVSNPTPCVGGLCASNSVTLTVTAPTPAPTLSSLSPNTAIAGGAAFSLTATGTNFTATSVVRVNGSPRTTTFVSATHLTAAVLASDIAAPGTPSITVFSPAPGGGTSSGKTLTVLGPSLTVDTTNVVPGGSATATLTNSPGGSTDWLTLALVGASETTYLQWVYVGAGVTTRTWTVTMPTTPGQYEFRFYLNNGFVRAATSPAVTVVTVNPTPGITSLSPAGVTAGGAAFSLTVTGSGFVSGATATVGGQARTVTVGSATQLTIAVPAADVANPGSVAVQVSSLAPCAGGLCASNSAALIVTAPTPAPTLSSLSPSTATAGGAAFTLTATGANFTANSVVQVNGSPRATTVVSATQLTATILASDIAAVGTPSITVVTPAPGGGTSTAIALSVNNPGPTLASISPSTAIVGGAAFTLTATGTNFAPTSVVRVNGVNRTTSFVSATQLAAAILASDIAAAGTPSVTVVTPAPGGGTSTAIALSVNNPVPTASTLTPSSVSQGGPAFALTVTGAGFAPASVVQVNGANRTTSFVSATQLTATILASDLASAATSSITVVTPTPGGGTSNALAFTITAVNPGPTLASISPNTAIAGGTGFTLTAMGANFTANSVVQTNGSPRATTVVSPTQLTATILGSDIANVGTRSITVVTPAPGGGTSSAIALSVNNPAPALSTLAPSSASQGGPAFTMTVTGTGFTPTSVVRVNGLDRTTSFVSANQLTATILASDLASAATSSVTVVTPTPGGGTSSALAFTITAVNPAPTLAGISPTTAVAGGAAFTLTTTGTNFTANSVIQVNGSPRTTTVVSATQLTAAVLASDIATAGTPSVTVVSPAPGGGTSAAISLSVNNPAPTLASISPSTASAGGAAFTLTATGTNFARTSVVQVNGVNRTTSFVSATQLTATILASDIAAAGTPGITVFTPTPGGGISSVAPLTVTPPSLTVSATSVLPGASLTATLNNPPGNASDLIALALVGSPATSSLQSVAVNTLPGTTSKAWTINMPTAPGQYEFRFFPNSGSVAAATSPTVTVVTVNPSPSITSVSPAGVTAGGTAFSLTVTGSGFVSGATATVGGQARTVTFSSATQLTIVVQAADVASPGPVAVQVSNPAPCAGGLCASNFVDLTVTTPTPTPTLSGISPSTAVAGGAAFALTATGTSFTASSVVRVNGSPRTTTFVSATQLTAALLASDIAAAGTPGITVFTPAPGGGASAAISLSVNNPGPTLASISPSTAIAGGAAFTLTVTGTDFTANSAVRVNGSPRATIVVSSIQLTASILGSDIAAAGTPSVTVVTPAPGGGTSSALALSVNNPAPTLSTLAPNSASQGGPAFTMTVTGAGFTPTSVVRANSVNRTTSFVSATRLTATFVASDLASAGTSSVTVITPTPGGGTSSALAFTITGVNPAPTLTSLSPTSASAGGAAFTLTASGTNFTGGSVVKVNGSPRATTVVSATQLTATILASDIALAGKPSITVVTPTPGGGTSSALALSVNNPDPTLASISPNTVTDDDPAFTLTVTGTNFVPTSVVRVNGENRTTRFLSATQLTATILASDIDAAGTQRITVVNPTPGGGRSSSISLTVNRHHRLTTSSKGPIATQAPTSSR